MWCGQQCVRLQRTCVGNKFTLCLVCLVLNICCRIVGDLSVDWHRNTFRNRLESKSLCYLLQSHPFVGEKKKCTKLRAQQPIRSSQHNRASSTSSTSSNVSSSGNTVWKARLMDMQVLVHCCCCWWWLVFFCFVWQAIPYLFFFAFTAFRSTIIEKALTTAVDVMLSRVVLLGIEFISILIFVDGLRCSTVFILIFMLGLRCDDSLDKVTIELWT